MTPALLTVVLSGLVLLIAQLVWLGFRDGDRADDARVEVYLDPVPAGTWVEVRVENRTNTVALVGAQIRRAGRWRHSVTRRTAGPRFRLAITEQTIGAVGAEEADSLWLWAEGDIRRLEVLAAIGTPGRLRLHRMRLGSRAVGRSVLLGPGPFPAPEAA